MKKLYTGKVKTIYETEHPDRFIMEFSDLATAFNGVKKAELNQKGGINNQINAYLMDYLASQGIKTHFIQLLSERQCLVKKLEMIPVECVVRNLAAGSLTKRLGVEKGKPLSPPVFELFYKSDELGDPMINESHVLTFGWASAEELICMQKQTLLINQYLSALFEKAGMVLVDFKLEFGRCGGEIVLGDEITPDGCRIWDAKTQEILDKDRFRQDLGAVIEAYSDIMMRLGVTGSISHAS